MASRKKRPVVVTTKHRGVFVGYTTDTDKADPITLTDARMVVYYSPGTRSVLGIAAGGVASGSRVSSAVPSITLRDVTAVMGASPEAVKAWEAEPWS